jgi:SAM-dependent methyltransferase
MNVPMEPRACPTCGRDDESVLFAEANVDPAQLGEYAYASRKLPEYMHLRLMECRRCDLLYASPAPPPGALSAAYNEASFDSAPEARFAAHTYGTFLPGLRLPDRVGAVDIGTGDGAFLHELLAAGFTQVTGVEPSAAPISVADPAVRPLIRHDIFKEGSFPPESVSLVTCFQTIEHVPDPLGLCREALRILKPGGAIYLVGHNRRALSAKVLGRKSPIFDIEHLQLFSPSGFRTLLDNAGFKDVAVKPLVSKYPLHYWTKLFPLPGSAKGAAIAALKATRIGYLPIPLPAGNLVAIAYKPATPASTA